MNAKKLSAWGSPRRGIWAGVWVAALATACALGGPLDKSHVDARAKWMVHADVEAVVSSAVGKFLIEDCAEIDMGPLDEFKEKTGLDTLRDIKGVTVYGMTDTPEEAVAVIYGTAKVEAAVEKLMSEDKTVERVQLGDGGRTAFKWSEDGTVRYGHLKNVEGDGRLFIVSRERAQLERALDVLDGSAESLSGVKDGPMAASPRKGSMVYAVVRELESAAKHAPKVLRTAREVKADFGEDASGLYAEMKLKTASEEDVKNIVHFARGLLALGRMACQEEEEMKDVARIIDGVKLEAAGTELTASFRIDKELLHAALAGVKSVSPKEAAPTIEKTSKGEKPR